jgi:hypothetical protein
MRVTPLYLPGDSTPIAHADTIPIRLTGDRAAAHRLRQEALNSAPKPPSDFLKPATLSRLEATSCV